MIEAPVVVSGCYIVRDEEAGLGRSLAALAPFVDEVVVYDTGSGDDTRAVARAHGARLVGGYWDDDFAAARNRALAECRGEWVVCVDADEVAAGDPRAWRRSLAMSFVSAHAVARDEEADGSRSWPTRVFRRTEHRWHGALHEQLAGTARAPRTGRAAHLVLRHVSAPVSGQVSRAGRILGIAQAVLRAAGARGEDLAGRHVDVARAAAAAGHPRAALDALAHVDPASLPAATGVPLARTALRCALEVRDADAGRRWLVPLRAWGEPAAVCRDLEGRLALAGGEHAVALPLLRSGTGELARPDLVLECLLRLERWDEVADAVIARVADGTCELSVEEVLEHVLRSAGGLQRLAPALPEAQVKPYVRHVKNFPWEVGGPFVEVLWNVGRGHAELLWAMGKLWSTMPVERALVWSTRLREAGLAQLCPLRRIVLSQEHDERSRVLSGAVLVEGGEVDALAVLQPVLEGLDEAVALAVLPELQEVAPRFAAALEPA